MEQHLKTPENNLPPREANYTPENSLKSPENHSAWRSILSTIALFILAFVFAGLLMAFAFQSYEVDGSSMETTLHNHDRLVVLKVPRTISRLSGHSYVPNRGDVIVFVKHNLIEYGQVGDKQLIKRVIGLPGDRVVVGSGKVTIYNTDHPNGFNPDATLPYGKAIPDTSGELDITVKPGEVFVCGDNRSNSLDSRSFGPIQSNDIVGKLIVRIFPLNETKKF
ncbi:MAG: signal peptidase I [Candidatus Saccharimonadales bacterium]